PRNVGAVAARAVGPPGPTNVALVVYLADLRQVEAGFGDTALAGALHLGGVPEAARYAVRALNPQSGRWTDLPDTSTGADGRLAVEVPAFREDLLLHLNRIE
ncbi:MAG: hypothetical protein ACRDI2_20575, partial [Chloroflexota bacterium]